MMLCANFAQHRFIKSTKSILKKILPTKMPTARSSTMMESFGMTNNFISRFSIK